jgi:hypothetical protein
VPRTAKFASVQLRAPTRRKRSASPMGRKRPRRAAAHRASVVVGVLAGASAEHLRRARKLEAAVGAVGVRLAQAPARASVMTTPCVSERGRSRYTQAAKTQNAPAQPRQLIAQLGFIQRVDVVGAQQQLLVVSCAGGAVQLLESGESGESGSAKLTPRLRCAASCAEVVLARHRRGCCSVAKLAGSLKPSAQAKGQWQEAVGRRAHLVYAKTGASRALHSLDGNQSPIFASPQPSSGDVAQPLCNHAPDVVSRQRLVAARLLLLRWRRARHELGAVVVCAAAATAVRRGRFLPIGLAAAVIPRQPRPLQPLHRRGEG